MTTKRGTAAEILAQLMEEQDKNRVARKAVADQALKEAFKKNDIEIERRVNEILNKRSEKEITGDINLMLLRLRDLYSERRGTILQDESSGDLIWCMTCGMEVVNLNDEPGVTCRDCRQAKD